MDELGAPGPREFADHKRLGFFPIKFKNDKHR